MRWTASIRVRLLAGLALVIVLGLVGSFLTTSSLLQSYLEDRDRDRLESSAQRVRSALASGPQVVEGEHLEVLLGDPLGAIVLGAQDRVVASTGSAERDASALVAQTAGRSGETIEVEPEGGGDLLALRIPTPQLTVRLGPDRTVSASAVLLTIDADIDDADVARLLRSQALVVALTVLVMIALALAVLRLGLRPLTTMATTATAIADGARGRRLSATSGGPEAAALAGAVNDAFDAQAAAEDRIRAFAADASHELRTPLATISGWLDLHHQGALATPEDRDRALARIDRETGRMRLMVEELSLLARLDAGRALAREQVDVARLATDVVEDALVVSAERTITVDAPTPAHVTGDEARLAQVLRNLVGNAVQHTPATATVAVAVRTEDDAVVVRVDDDGPGIPPEQLPHVFERFWRADPSRSRAHGGSGLGLAIVQAIVQAHDGTVTASRRPGGGTRFEVRLPRSAG